MSHHAYSKEFYDYIDSGSRSSARNIARLLLGEMEIASLLDVGAGRGAWAAEWMAAGVADVVAVDGAYVDRSQLAIPAERFVSHDLTQPLDLQRRFDLVQSLEVAEHLSPQHAGTLVDSLARHGDVVFFSAAVPNQGGEHHVNEQPPEYWRALFARHGFQAFDWIRPSVALNRDIKAWYRFNSILYANAAGQKRLSTAILDCRVAEGQPLPIGGSFGWALRRAAVSLVPAALVKPIARAKSLVEIRLRG